MPSTTQASRFCFFMADSGQIEMFGPNLFKLAQSRQVIGVDLQGHGATVLGERELSLVDMGNDMAGVLKKLGYDKGRRARLFDGRWRRAPIRRVNECTGFPALPREQCVSRCRRSEEVGQQGGSLSGIGSIRFPKQGVHPLLLHAELKPEHQEDEEESDKSAHLGQGDRGAKQPGQNAGVDGVTDHGIGPGGDQLVSLLDRDFAAPVAAQVLSRPDGEQKAGDHDGSSQPKGPKPARPGLKIEPAQRDAS